MSTPATSQLAGFDGFTHDAASAPWFVEKLELSWPARQLLEEYSGIPPEDVEREVTALRSRAWETFPFPCIGAFDFLDFHLSTRNLLYPRLLQRLQAGATFLDIGCCLGHDIRKLVFDGAPAENLVGVELRKGFIDLGYDLFRDRDTLRAKLLQGDATSDGSVDPWPQLEGKFDVVNLGLILHVFPWEGQVALLERGIENLKQGQLGTSLIGLACGAIDDGTVLEWAGGIPAHNEETFRRLVEEVEARTGTKWKVDVRLDTAISTWIPKHRWLDPRARRVVFELTRRA